MKRFEYRQPRFSVDLAVQFSIAKNAHAARCTNISAKGLRLDLLKTVAPGCRCVLRLHRAGQTVALNARVVHTDGRHSGLEFLYDLPEEQTNLQQLLSVLTAPCPRRGLSLVPKCDASNRQPHFTGIKLPISPCWTRVVHLEAVPESRPSPDTAR